MVDLWLGGVSPKMVDLRLGGGAIDPKASQSGINAAAVSGTCKNKYLLNLVITVELYFLIYI
jgi:hypothetical protein